MGKKGDLWDDSALIDAFDSAMCKYKKMHKIECDATTGDVKDAFAVDETESDNSIRESCKNNTAASSAEMEMAETHCLSLDKENHSEDLRGLETYVDSSNGVAGVPKDDSYLLGTDDYNELLKQYYEVEEKRQSVMQQLNQFGSWNYQYSGEGSVSAAQWGTYSASQDYTVPVRQTSHPITPWSCCPYVAQCMECTCTPLMGGTPGCRLCADNSAAQWGTYSASQDYTVPVRQTSHPITPWSCCPYVAQCMECTCTPLMGGTPGCRLCADNSAAKGTGKSVAEDGDMVKTAMEAAEQAISFMRLKSEVDSHVNEENGEELATITSSQTDLNDVLKAWYSAGFYTGKYLVEQSIAKKSHS